MKIVTLEKGRSEHCFDPESNNEAYAMRHLSIPALKVLNEPNGIMIHFCAGNLSLGWVYVPKEASEVEMVISAKLERQ